LVTNVDGNGAATRKVEVRFLRRRAVFVSAELFYSVPLSFVIVGVGVDMGESSNIDFVIVCPQVSSRGVRIAVLLVVQMVKLEDLKVVVF
jgi:hypothetical protein